MRYIMIAESMKALVKGSSVIRAMFEEGNRLAKIYGVENVYERMETNPQQFAISRDSYLASKNYREALIP